MISLDPQERPSIEDILNDPWFKEIKDLNNKQLTQLEYEIRKELLEREKIAQKVERESIDIKMAEFMQDKIGEEYDGIISNITSFGVFVELENTVEGLIRFEKLGNEYFIYDDEHKYLIGEHSNEVLKVGDKMRIRVIEANKLLRRISFERVNE